MFQRVFLLVLLHNHLVDHFPTQIGQFRRIVNVSGMSCRPEGLLRPSKHQEYTAVEKVPTPCEKPNTAGTSGHGPFSSLLMKKRTNNIRKVTGYRPLINSNASVRWYGISSHGEMFRPPSVKREFVMVVGMLLTALLYLYDPFSCHPASDN